MDKIHLLDHKIKLYQPNQGFRTSQDAVLLAAACPAKKEETVLDMGCGVGGALFCLLWRKPQLHVTGIEIEQDYVTLAEKNAIENNMKANLVKGNVVQYRVNDPILRYNHIICNPPFFDFGTHTPSPSETKARARGHQDQDNTLENWIKSAFENLKPMGSLTIIQKTEKLDNILQALGKRFGATEIIPIYSKPGEPSKRVIIKSFKERKSPCIMLPPVFMHHMDSTPTETADRLLREGLSFDKVFETQRMV